MLKRTHKCGELHQAHIGQKVVLYGWARNIRDHKDIVFVNLTDRYGWVQVDMNKDQKEQISREAFLCVEGEVIPRPADQLNPNIPTGEVEVKCERVTVTAECKKQLPFEIQDQIDASEETRLKFRVLDLRRPIMLERLKLRSKMAMSIRRAMEQRDFLEVETPMLVRSTGEGARDFVVPSRVYPGSFFSLPQSPQLYKQMLMVSGFDRYYQFARCYRDEDPKRERQHVHTQVDIEMALITPEDLFDLVEFMLSTSCRETFGIALKTPFPRYTYEEVMRRFGSDKPDMRFAMEILDFATAAAGCGCEVLEKPLANKEEVKGLVLPGCAPYSRKQVEDLEKVMRTYHNNGPLFAFRVSGGKLEGSLAKKMNAESLGKLLARSEAKDGDLIVVTAGKSLPVHKGLGELRRTMGKRLKLYKEDDFCFLWITDFPLFEWNEEEKKWDPMHHMFTMPKEQYVDNFEKNPGDVTGQLYDLVLNGVELGSGSIRITSPELQKRIMEFVGIKIEEAERRFGFLLEAYQYASPFHGGIGIGFDRLVMTILHLENIRDVMAFPNAGNGTYLFDGSPAPLEPRQIKELHIKIVGEEKEKT